MPTVVESTGEENANLYKRGVNEGSRGELLDASELLELLDVFGDDGVRSYLVGFLEGVDDAMEEDDELELPRFRGRIASTTPQPLLPL